MGKSATSNAVSVVEQLRAFGTELRTAAAKLKEHQHVYRSLIEAADRVGKSASGGWLGYHSRIYKRGFKEAAPGEYWDTEWGGHDAFSNQTRGDWCEYTYEGVVEYIERLAGAPDLEAADQAVRTNGAVFDRVRDSATAVLAAISDGDAFLVKVNERIEAIPNGLSPNAILMALGGGRTHSSRDMRAANAGIQTPPHLGVKANAMVQLSHIEACSSVADEIERAATYLSTKHGVSPTVTPASSQRGPVNPIRTASVNILFLDLVGWSKLDPAQIANYLEKALPRLAKIVERYRCTHQNTWGDALVATFGSAKEAADCALDIRDMFRRGSESDGVAKGLVPRISLHQGEVITVHNPLIDREDIFGDAVHLAARLEPVTPKGQVYCTKAFADALDALTGMAAVAHDIGVIDVAKGFGRVQVFLVTGPNEEPPRSP